MVIQRIQSLYLLIATILMGVYAFMPTLIDAGGNVVLQGSYTTLTMGTITFALNCLVALLSLIAIFKFKNIKLQRSLCVICILLTLASLATVIAVGAMLPQGLSVEAITLYNLLPLVAIIFFLLAHKGITHDKKLLSDSGRIR